MRTSTTRDAPATKYLDRAAPGLLPLAMVDFFAPIAEGAAEFVPTLGLLLLGGLLAARLECRRLATASNTWRPLFFVAPVSLACLMMLDSWWHYCSHAERLRTPSAMGGGVLVFTAVFLLPLWRGGARGLARSPRVTSLRLALAQRRALVTLAALGLAVLAAGATARGAWLRWHRPSPDRALFAPHLAPESEAPADGVCRWRIDARRTLVGRRTHSLLLVYAPGIEEPVAYLTGPNCGRSLRYFAPFDLLRSDESVGPTVLSGPGGRSLAPTSLPGRLAPSASWIALGGLASLLALTVARRFPHRGTSWLRVVLEPDGSVTHLGERLACAPELAREVAPGPAWALLAGSPGAGPFRAGSAVRALTSLDPDARAQALARFDLGASALLLAPLVTALLALR